MSSISAAAQNLPVSHMDALRTKACLDAVKIELSRVKESHGDFTQKLSEIETGVKEMKEWVSTEVKSFQRNVKLSITSNKNHLLKEVTEKQEEMGERLKGSETTLDGIDERLSNVEKSNAQILEGLASLQALIIGEKRVPFSEPGGSKKSSQQGTASSPPLTPVEGRAGLQGSLERVSFSDHPSPKPSTSDSSREKSPEAPKEVEVTPQAQDDEVATDSNSSKSATREREGTGDTRDSSVTVKQPSALESSPLQKVEEENAMVLDQGQNQGEGQDHDFEGGEEGQDQLTPLAQETRHHSQPAPSRFQQNQSLTPPSARSLPLPDIRNDPPSTPTPQSHQPSPVSSGGIPTPFKQGVPFTFSSPFQPLVNSSPILSKTLSFDKPPPETNPQPPPAPATPIYPLTQSSPSYGRKRTIEQSDDDDMLDFSSSDVDDEESFGQGGSGSGKGSGGAEKNEGDEMKEDEPEEEDEEPKTLEDD